MNGNHESEPTGKIWKSVKRGTHSIDQECMKIRIDFELCRKKLGFNDAECKCNIFLDIVQLQRY